MYKLAALSLLAACLEVSTSTNGSPMLPLVGERWICYTHASCGARAGITNSSFELCITDEKAAEDAATVWKAVCLEEHGNTYETGHLGEACELPNGQNAPFGCDVSCVSQFEACR